jgi:hypothetical protein
LRVITQEEAWEHCHDRCRIETIEKEKGKGLCGKSALMGGEDGNVWGMY